MIMGMCGCPNPLGPQNRNGESPPGQPGILTPADVALGSRGIMSTTEALCWLCSPPPTLTTTFWPVLFPHLFVCHASPPTHWPGR